MTILRTRSSCFNTSTSIASTNSTNITTSRCRWSCFININISCTCSSISSINDIRNSIDAIGTDFNSMMRAFDEISPDYEDWNGVSAEQYARQMDKVREAWDKAVNQSMLSGTVASPDEQQQTADTVTQLVEAAQNAEGTTGAIQALAQLNAIQINELQKMLAITSDAQRTQNMYFKRQIEAEEAGRRRTEIMMDNYEANLKADVSITGDGSDIHHFTR